MVQTKWVIAEIRKKAPSVECEIVPIRTKGDILLDKRLDSVGGKGLFITELENALLDRTIDLAVHSMKDMPAEIPAGLMIGAVSKREDPRDVLVTPGGGGLASLASGALVGTSSLRREVQLLALRPDLRCKLLRGNVPTRLHKLLAGEYDALILAAAGLKRLGWEEKCTYYFSTDAMIPAAGQGVLGIEMRSDTELAPLLADLHDSTAAWELSAERAFIARLNGGCSTPSGVYAYVAGETMKVTGLCASADLATLYKATVEGSKHTAVQLGRALADKILQQRGSPL
jgi:hydroxymethylbilane synthase